MLLIICFQLNVTDFLIYYLCLGMFLYNPGHCAANASFRFISQTCKVNVIVIPQTGPANTLLLFFWYTIKLLHIFQFQCHVLVVYLIPPRFGKETRERQRSLWQIIWILKIIISTNQKFSNVINCMLMRIS